MPLKAKIIDPRVESRAQMSTAEVTKEVPDYDPDDVRFSSLYGLRTIELNRPKKLNALNESMIRKILPRLQEWKKSHMANVIVLKGAGDRSLCAGGDVTALAKSNMEGPEGQQRSADYFSLEYKLNHYIATYKKPYIAFMDGITMGGGVGLSIHAPFRIATERTVFAMPETTIGFFPDVGASFFLPRMNGAVGTYLALTSDRLMGANAFYSGIATHYLHSSSLPALESRLAELQFKDWDDLETRLKQIEMTIEEFSTGLPHDVPFLLSGELRKAIDRSFSQPTVPDVIAALKEEMNGPVKEWAEKTLDTLHQRSPTSVYVTLKQMQDGIKWSISETFQREQMIAAKFMRHPDFTEGVSALLMSTEKPKPKPKWQPATLGDVQPSDDIAKPFFQGFDDPSKLILGKTDFKEYPFRELGVPSERYVKSVAKRASMSRKQIVDTIVEQKKGRQGTDVIVKEILDRKTVRDENGHVRWVEK